MTTVSYYNRLRRREALIREMKLSEIEIMFINTEKLDKIVDERIRNKKVNG